MAGDFHIEYTPTAIDLIRDIGDGRVKRRIRDQIDALESDPILQGKPLQRDLRGLFSVRVSQRYRVVYGVDEAAKKVIIWGAGIRKEGDKSDIYRVVGRILAKIRFR